jgi:hypothetical protein
MPVLQFLLGTCIVGAFVFVYGSLTSLQAQLGQYQTSQALLSQDVQYLKRSDANQAQNIETLNRSDQDHTFQLKALNEYLKAELINRRPRT